MKKTLRIIVLLAAIIVATGQTWAALTESAPQNLFVEPATGGTVNLYDNQGCTGDPVTNAARGATVYIKAVPDIIHGYPSAGMIAAEKTVNSEVAQARGASRSSTTIGLGEYLDVTAVGQDTGIFSFTMPDDGNSVSITVTFPEAPVSYINAAGQTVDTGNETVRILTGSETSLNAGWYVTDGELNYSQKIRLNGDVHLILQDGAVMNVGTEESLINGDGISGYDYSLCIYAQSTGDSKGQLRVNATDVAIYAKNVTINGGQVTANGSAFGISSLDKVTISGGQVTANGGSNGGSTGIVALGNVILGWTSLTDFIQANSYYSENGTVSIAEGKAFAVYDGETLIKYLPSGTLSNQQVSALGGKTLRPVASIPVVAPKNLTITNVTVSGATLTWEPGNVETQWQVAYSTDGGSNWSNAETVTTTTYTLTGLAAGTSVIARVRAYYNDNLYSDFATSTFTTLSPVSYIDADGSTKQCADYTVLTGSETSLAGGWYVADGELNYSQYITPSGDVHLILKDGAVMNIDTEQTPVNGISSYDYSLCIYAQSTGDNQGQLHVNATYNAIYAKNVTISGGQVTANGSAFGITSRENVTINGGQVTANGGSDDGIAASGSITLGWTSLTDFIQANSYYSDNGSISIADGKAFKVYDGETLTSYLPSGTLNNDQVWALRGKTLRPVTSIPVVVPQTLAITNVTLTGATLTWEPGDLETQWQVAYSTDGGTTWSNAETVTTTTYTLTGLTAGIAVTLRVRSYYNDNLYSDYATCTFTTSPPVTYLDAEGNTQQCASFTILTGSEGSLDAGWYVAEGTLNYGGSITLNDDVHLILKDGAVMNIGTEQTPLNVYECISANGHSLSIYAQSTADGMGKLNIYSGRSNALGIYMENGSLTINGGEVTSGSSRSFWVRGDDFTINGGAVTATQDIIVESGTLTLSWTSLTDFIRAGSYQLYNGASVVIAEGKMFAVYSGESLESYLESGPVTNVTRLYGKTLRPVTSIPVAYLDEWGTPQKCMEYTVLTGNETELAEGWYVANGTLNYGGSINLTGDVHLILKDGAVMNIGTEQTPIDFASCIDGDGHSLSIYAQSIGDVKGKLNLYSVKTSGVASGIHIDSGTLTINGGEVTSGSENSFNIGGDFTINGGQVTATQNIFIDGGTLTMGWTSTNDFIKAASYQLVGNASVAIAEDRAFKVYDGESLVAFLGSGTLTSQQVTALYGKTLRPSRTSTPEAPLELVASLSLANGLTSAKLSWWQFDDDAKDWLVAYSTDGGTNWSNDVMVTEPVYSMTGLAEGQTVTVRVRTSYSEELHSDYTTYTFTTLSPVDYIDAEGNTQTCTAYTTLTGTEDSIGIETNTEGITRVVDLVYEDSWYVATGLIGYLTELSLGGNVHLILADGATVNFQNQSATRTAGNRSIIGTPAKLNIYGQQAGTGTINTSGMVTTFGLTVNGGTLNTYCQQCEQAITVMGDFTVNGGTVYAQSQGTAIMTNSTDGTTSADITINGGKVTANGGSCGILSYGNITLGTTKASDYIYATRYVTTGTLAIADGKTLYDEDGNAYSGEQALIPNTDPDANPDDPFTAGTYAIDGKTLRHNAPNLCSISYTLGTSDGSTNWNGCSILVVDSVKRKMVAQITLTENEPNSGELTFCDGTALEFYWQEGFGTTFQYPTFTLTGPDGYVIATESKLNLQSGSMQDMESFAEYTMNCNACKLPQNLAVSNITTTSATVTWLPGGEETQWAVSYRDIDAGEAMINETFDNMTSLPDGWNCYSVGDKYPPTLIPIEDWAPANGALVSTQDQSYLFIPVQFGGKARLTVRGSNSNGYCGIACYRNTDDLTSLAIKMIYFSGESQEVVLDMSEFEGSGYLAVSHSVFSDEGNTLYLEQLSVTGPSAWSEPVTVTGQPTYTLENLTPETPMQVSVQAVCDAENGDMSRPATVSFYTSYCEPENQCAISYTLGITNPQYPSWYGATIKVVHHETGAEVGKLTYIEGADNTGELFLCNGETYDFIFESGEYTPYGSFTLTGPDGYVFADYSEITFEGQFAQYTINCNACKLPQNLAVSNITTTSATVTWQPGGDEEQWAVSYRDIDAGEVLFNETFDNTSLPEGWKSYKDEGDWSTSDDWPIADGELVSSTRYECLFIPVKLGGKAHLTLRGRDSGYNGCVISCFQGSIERRKLLQPGCIDKILSATAEEVEVDMTGYEGDGYLYVYHYGDEQSIIYIEQIEVTGPSAWGELIPVSGQPTYTIVPEESASGAAIQVRVQAVCDAENGDMSRPATILFYTSVCEPENQCAISYELGIYSPDNSDWNGATIKVVHHETGAVAGTLTYTEGAATNTGELFLCNGETYDFIFNNPRNFGDAVFTLWAPNGDEIATRSYSPAEGRFAQYTMDCDVCKVPKNLAVSELHPTSATVTWQPRGDETQWKVSYRDVNAGVERINETFDNMTSLPNEWTVYNVNQNMHTPINDDWNPDSEGALVSTENGSILFIPVELGGKAHLTVSGNNSEGICDIGCYQGSLENYNQNILSDCPQYQLSTTPTNVELDLSDYEGSGYLFVLHFGNTGNIAYLKQLMVTGPSAWSEPVMVTEQPSYTLENLTPETSMQVRVQAVCSVDDLSRPATVSFNVPFCEAENQCAISYALGITNPQYPSWYGSSIKVVHHSTGVVVGKLTYTDGADNTGELFLCNGETYDFVFDNPQGYPYTTFTLTDPDGYVIADYPNSPNVGQFAQYTMNCNTCQMPQNLAVSNITTTSATVTWLPGGDEEQWAVSYRDVNAGAVLINETFTTSLPSGWEAYTYGGDNGITSSENAWHIEDGALVPSENNVILTIPVQSGDKAYFTLHGSANYANDQCIVFSYYQGNLKDFNAWNSKYVDVGLSTTPQTVELDLSGYEGEGYIYVDYYGGVNGNIAYIEQIMVNGPAAWSKPVMVTEQPSYTLENLTPETPMQVSVQAVCDAENGDMSRPATISFYTSYCEPENQCAISYELADSDGDGWNDASIAVVRADDGKEVASLTMTSGTTLSGELPLCPGEYNFIWKGGSYDNDCSFTIYDPDGNEIVSASEPSAGPLLSVPYVHSCGYDFAIVNNSTNNSAVLADYAGQAVSVMLQGRTLYKDCKWNTLCLPFAVALDGSPLEGATLKELDTEHQWIMENEQWIMGDAGRKTGLDTSDGTLYLFFTDAESIEAGKPYLIRWAEGTDIVDPVFTNVVIDASASTEVPFGDGDGSFIGIYDRSDIFSTEKDNFYLGSNNKLYYPWADGMEHYYVNALRAYFHINDPSKVRAFSLSFGDGAETQGIVDNKRETITNNHWYTLDGVRLDAQPTRKGVYIHGGRKVVIK